GRPDEEPAGRRLPGRSGPPRAVRSTARAVAVHVIHDACRHHLAGKGTPAPLVPTVAPAGSADLDPGHRRVRPGPPPDRIAVADRALSLQRDAVEGQPVAAQVRDPPLALG